MCLSSISSNKARDIKRLKVDSRGYIKVWKVFCVSDGGYLHPQYNYRNSWFYEGKNTACSGNLYSYHSGRSYKSGFHCFITKEDARKWKLHHGGHMQSVLTRPRWIVALGKQGANGGPGGTQVRSIVCKHIIV